MENGCEVWLASTDLARPKLGALLDEAERARIARFVCPADRARALLAAALLRLGAGKALGRPARDVAVLRVCASCGGPHGKPSIGGLEASVSHASGLVAVALTRAVRVGIDLEVMDGTARAHRAAQLACCAPELARVRNEHDALRYWTRKEAIVKATGDGLRVAPPDIHVSAPEDRPQLLAWHGRTRPDCTLVDLDLPDGYVGALAVLTHRLVDVVARPGAELLAAV